MMKNKKTVLTYSYRSKVMHAIVALIIIGLLIIGSLLTYIPEAYQDQAYMLHKSFGLLVLMLMLLRIGFILRDGRPKLPASVSTWEKVLARGVQYLLYIVLLAMPISGWVMSVAANYIPQFFDLFPMDLPFVPKDKALASNFSSVHYYLAWLIFGLLILHFLGNIKHYFYDKDKLVSTMWRFKK